MVPTPPPPPRPAPAPAPSSSQQQLPPPPPSTAAAAAVFAAPPPPPPGAGSGGQEQQAQISTQTQPVSSAAAAASVSSASSASAAVPPPPPPPPPPPSSAAVPPPPPAAAAASVPVVAAPSSAPPPAAATARTIPSGPAGSLESLADALLSGPTSPDAQPSSPSQPAARQGTPRQVPILHPPPLPRNESGLQRARTLAGRRAWVDVLAVTGDLLHGTTSPCSRWYAVLSGETGTPRAADGSGSGGGGGSENAEEDARHQADTNKLLRLRLTAYLRLRRHVDLAREVERLNLLDQDDDEDDENDGENVNPAADFTSGSGGGSGRNASKSMREGLPIWVDMTLMIMAATSLLYTDPGNPQRCLDELHRLRVQVTHNRKLTAVRYLNRIDVAIANVHMRRKEWRLALAALDDVVQNLDGGVSLEIERRMTSGTSNDDNDNNTKIRDWLRTALRGAARIEIRSRQGWIFLQTGAIPEAEKMFALAERERPAVEMALKDVEAYVVSNPNDVLAKGLAETALVRQAPARCLANDGLRLLALQQYEEAMQCFTDAMKHLQNDPTQQMSAAPPYHDEEEMAATIGFGSDGSGGPGPPLIAPCLNNLALCALYTCRMHHAVAMMESLVREGPTMFLTERLAFNLCTLYELGSDGPGSERKKRVLQLVSKRFFLHDIGSESFRIS